MTNIEKKTRPYIQIICYLVIFAACTYLFYKQATAQYQSDTPVHLAWALQGGGQHYSIIGLFLIPSFSIGGYLGVAIMLAFIEMATIWTTQMILKRMLPLRPLAILAIAVICNFMIAIYIPYIWSKFYIGVICGNLWHNATYQMMRLFALVSIYAYFCICNSFPIPGRFHIHSRVWWAVFMGSIVLAALIKPSFAVVFGPSIALLCVIDYIKNKNTLKRCLGFAGCLFGTLIILLVQYKFIYVNGSDDSNIAFGFMTYWSTVRPDTYFGLLQSFIFPIIVYLGCCKYVQKSRSAVLGIMMLAFGLFVFLFMYEDGSRFTHGNMGWSLCFATFYINISSIELLCKTYNKYIPAKLINTKNEAYICESNNSSGQKTVLSKLFFGISIMLFLLEGIDGIIWFINLLGGVPYYA